MSNISNSSDTFLTFWYLLSSTFNLRFESFNFMVSNGQGNIVFFYFDWTADFFYLFLQLEKVKDV